MNDKVICPYCGSEMKQHVECCIPKVPRNHPDYWECNPEWNYRVCFVCDPCSKRTSNMLHSPVEHAETEKDAVVKAYASAMGKYRLKKEDN